MIWHPSQLSRLWELKRLRLEIPTDDPVELADELANVARSKGSDQLAALLDRLSVDLESRIEDDNEDEEVDER